MNRYDAYYPRDTAPHKDGDSGFVGVDERLDPELLQPGTVAAATNCRFRHGRGEPRRGITILPWMRGDGRTPFNTSRGMHVFKVSPPGSYVDFVGTSAPFAPDGTNDALIGVRFTDIQNVLSVDILLNGSPASRWSSSNAAFYPVGIISNGVLATTAYTASLNLQAQEIVLAISLNSLGGSLASCYLQIGVLCTTGGGTGYLTYGP
jgi:hypothetical protein